MFIRKYTRGAQCCSYSPYAMWSIPHEVFQTFLQVRNKTDNAFLTFGYSPLLHGASKRRHKISKNFLKFISNSPQIVKDLCFFKIKMAKTTSGSVFLAIIFSGLRSILHPYIYDTKIPSET